MQKNEIKIALLKSVGDPEIGPIAAYADQMAQAVYDLLNPQIEVKKYEKIKETRTIEPKETRNI